MRNISHYPGQQNRESGTNNSWDEIDQPNWIAMKCKEDSPWATTVAAPAKAARVSAAAGRSPDLSACRRADQCARANADNAPARAAVGQRAASAAAGFARARRSRGVWRRRQWAGRHCCPALGHDGDHAVVIARVAAGGLLDGDGFGAVVQRCWFCRLRFFSIELKRTSGWPILVQGLRRDFWNK